MATKRSRLESGRERASELVAALRRELRTARILANISQDALAAQLGWSQSRYSEFERNKRPLAVEDLCVVAALLGLQPSISLNRLDEGLRDRGQIKLMQRLKTLLSPLWRVTEEAPFPQLFDMRSWDALLKLGEYLVGVEAETRLRDQQELVRRIRQRELHGGVDHILVVLSDSAHNRRLVVGLRESLGEGYTTAPAAIRQALASGRPLPGSGVILL